MNANHLSKILLLVVLLPAAALAQEDRARIANEGTIGDQWMLAPGTTLATAQYPAHLAARGANVCIALAYTIDRHGNTSDFQVLKQWSSETGDKQAQAVDGYWLAFAEAGADALVQWKFQPRPEVKNPRPTLTVATLGFTAQEGVNGTELRSHCQIGDLAAFMASQPTRNSSVNHDLDRNRNEQDQNFVDQMIQSRQVTP